jgi:SAM-dependent methyltransferase
MGINTEYQSFLNRGVSTSSVEHSIDPLQTAVPNILRSRKLAYLRATQATVDNFEKENARVTHTAFGFPLTIVPGVYSAHPDFSHSSGIVIDNLPARLDGKSFLDVGCGAGVIALSAAYKGAANVVALDYNVNALGLTCDNLYANNLQSPNIELMPSDVLQSVMAEMPYRRFDVVAANLWFPVYEPSLDRNDPTPYLGSYHRFFGNVRGIMKPDGIAMLTSADFAEVEMTRILMSDYGIEPHLTVADKTHFGGTVPMQWHLYTFGAQGQPVDPQEWARRQAPAPIAL